MHGSVHKSLKWCYPFSQSLYSYHVIKGSGVPECVYLLISWVQESMNLWYPDILSRITSRSSLNCSPWFRALSAFSSIASSCLVFFLAYMFVITYIAHWVKSGGMGTTSACFRIKIKIKRLYPQKSGTWVNTLEEYMSVSHAIFGLHMRNIWRGTSVVCIKRYNQCNCWMYLYTRDKSWTPLPGSQHVHQQRGSLEWLLCHLQDKSSGWKISWVNNGEIPHGRSIQKD